MPLFIIIIHLIYIRAEQNIAACLFQQTAVGFKGTGIFFKVFRIVELGRVYKNTAYYHIVLLLSQPDKRQMPLVQRTHSGHKTDALACSLKLKQILMYGLFGCKCFQYPVIKNPAKVSN